MSTTDIIKADAELPAIADVAAQLDRLEDSGETELLSEVAKQADAYRHYAQRNKAAERAAYFSRIKVMAEARIGSIDLALHPVVRKAGSLKLNGEMVSTPRRCEWRILAYGLQAGVLDKAMRHVEPNCGGISTQGVVRYLQHEGVGYVDTAPLLKAYRQMADRPPVKKLSAMCGINVERWLTLSAKPRGAVVSRAIAVQVAPILGVDLSELRPVPYHHQRKPKPRRRHQPPLVLKGGRLDETYCLVRKAQQELGKVIGTSDQWGLGEAYDHLYQAEDLIGRAMKRAPFRAEGAS